MAKSERSHLSLYLWQVKKNFVEQFASNVEC